MSETPIPRAVDLFTVRDPSFYGDEGGSGWYAELQYPVQRRLEVIDLGGGPIYIRPKEIMLYHLEEPVKRAEIYADYDDFGVVTIDMLAPIRDGKYSGTRSVIIEFDTTEGVSDALEQASTMFQSGYYRFLPRHVEVNTSGPKAWTTQDIVLVKEEWAIRRDLRAETTHEAFHRPIQTAIRGGGRKGKKRDRHLLDANIGKDDALEQALDSSPKAPDQATQIPRQTVRRGRPFLGGRQDGHQQPAHSGTPPQLIEEKKPAAVLDSNSESEDRVANRPIQTAKRGTGRRGRRHGRRPQFDSYAFSSPSPVYSPSISDSSHGNEDLTAWSGAIPLRSKSPVVKPYPSLYAITTDGLLILAQTADQIAQINPYARPKSVWSLPPEQLRIIGLEEVTEMRWNVTKKSKAEWRRNYGMLYFPATWQIEEQKRYEYKNNPKRHTLGEL